MSIPSYDFVASSTLLYAAGTFIPQGTFYTSYLGDNAIQMWCWRDKMECAIAEGFIEPTTDMYSSNTTETFYAQLLPFTVDTWNNNVLLAHDGTELYPPDWNANAAHPITGYELSVDLNTKTIHLSIETRDWEGHSYTNEYLLAGYAYDYSGSVMTTWPTN